jgi:hypothetical protein
MATKSISPFLSVNSIEHGKAMVASLLSHIKKTQENEKKPSNWTQIKPAWTLTVRKNERTNESDYDMLTRDRIRVVVYLYFYLCLHDVPNPIQNYLTQLFLITILVVVVVDFFPPLLSLAAVYKFAP